MKNLNNNNLLFPLLLLLYFHQSTHAAHSHKRPTINTRSTSTAAAEKYDRSISTFSTDGRLLQVEYSTHASNRGTRIVAAFELDLSCCLKRNGGKKRGGGAVCVAILKEEDEEEDEEDENHNNEKKKESEESEEDATVLLKEETLQTKIHRITPTSLLFTTGLKGDGRILATALRYNALASLSTQQNGEEASVEEIANVLGRVQHELTWTGGARPLGVTATLVGVQQQDDDEGEEVVKLFQCAPGGVIHSYECCVAGGGSMERNAILDGLVDLRKEFDLLIQQHQQHQQQTIYDAKSKNGENKEVEEEEKEKEIFCQNLLTDMVQKVGKVVLDASSSSSTLIFSTNPHNNDCGDDDDEEEQEQQKNKRKKRRKIDLWVIQPSTASSSKSSTSQTIRKNALIRYATDVTQHDLAFVSKQMFA